MFSSTTATPSMVPQFPRPSESHINSGESTNHAEDLPVYSANPAYESVPHSQDITRRVVKDHEKKVKRDLREAQKAEIECAKIKQLLPEIYAQLAAACDAPRPVRQRTGPAALRQQEEEQGVEIKFTSRSIDRKALRQYLPLLLADYQRQVEAEQSSTASQEEPSVHLHRSMTEPVLEHETLLQHQDTLETTAARPSLLHAVTTSQARYYDPDRMSVTPGYFDGYTQKIYFSKKFVNLWKKKANGKRENLASGIAMVLIGMKLGLPIFDLVTFTAIDLPRLALQSLTGKQTLKFRD
ncbi:protein of unknown function [Taphrina deformans PYCC 5710]|uniref:Uncharacterized protein n=1 Tax=Taphrina deformans (strain PYCC 5710 / ATCC 11124 / CBS 356.35 / IMI 108563 / JCM 9778 / NBRC 8474) TaxID=1097556 RepID=R4XBK2_TAPDE|nr:protein of unknown function [Taphrina deformans PYCC 5710]|eukprot:CCG83158.1 protein of unknown function [Taphrina deformans PYCC 5710]